MSLELLNVVCMYNDMGGMKIGYHEYIADHNQKDQ